MLDSLRRHASGWLAKGLFIILALSFVFWGIPQEFTGFGQAPLATVGSTRITAEEFQQNYQNQLSAIARQSGERLTPEQARLFGLDRNILSQLVNTAALTNQADKLGLSLSDAALAEAIQNNPDFQGPDGKFSREGFEGLLRQVGLSEQAFLALQRKDELIQQLVGALRNAVAAPKPLIELMHRYRDEKRTIAHFTVDAGKAVTVAKPDDAKLKQTYEDNKFRFMSPEYRQIAALVMGLEQIGALAPVSDEEIKAAYEADKDSFDEPERRRIQQIAFKDAAAAAEAKKAIGGGKAFTDIAKEQGATLSDIELGLLTKKQLIDPNVADAAFTIEKDKVSEPVGGRFATVLLRVSEIQPGKQKTLDEVKDQLRDRLLKEKSKTVFQKLHDDVEDARAAGKPLKEIAEAKKLKFIDVPATSSENKTPDGKRAIEIADAEAVIVTKAGFDAAVGIETESVELTDGGYAWVDLIAVTASAQKPFEAVKDEVEKLYIDTERARLLSELSAKIVERIKAGETLDALAKEFGGSLQTTEPATRTAGGKGLTDPAMKQAFGLPQGAAGSAESEDGKSRVVFKVEAIEPASDPTKEQTEKIADELRQAMRKDAIAAYLEALKERQIVKINEDALRRATGAEAPQ